MSITALILTTTLSRRDELAVQHGPGNIERSIFVTAARLIAGEYQN